MLDSLSSHTDDLSELNKTEKNQQMNLLMTLEL